MLPEISLNILDVAENSIVADASLIKIMVETDTSENKLKVTIEDDGCGMNEEQVASVVFALYREEHTSDKIIRKVK